MPENIIHYANHTGIKPEKFYKTTLFREKNLLLGLNCLEPEQVQPVHDHADQDKFYYVIEGQGTFTVADDIATVGPGHIVWARAGILHGVENKGHDRLILLVGIAPAPN